MTIFLKFGSRECYEVTLEPKHAVETAAIFDIKHYKLLFCQIYRKYIRIHLTLYFVCGLILFVVFVTAFVVMKG